MIRNHKVKMCILLATAIGAGALAAYVGPWFYFKRPDDNEDNCEATGDDQKSDDGNDFSNEPNIRTHDFVSVVIPPTPPEKSNRAVSTSQFCEVNSTIEKNLASQQADNNVTAYFSGTADSDKMNWANVESVRNHYNSGEIASKIENLRKPLIPEVENLGVFNSASNPEHSRLSMITGDNTAAILPSRKSSSRTDQSPSKQTDESTTDPTDRSSTEPISDFTTKPSTGDSSVTSENSKIESSQDAASKLKDFCSNESKDFISEPESTLPASSTQSEYSSSKIWTTFDSSNPTGNWSTESANEGSSQDLEKSSSGPTRLLTASIVESSKFSSYLETVQEVTSSCATSLDPSPRLPRQLASSSLNTRTPILNAIRKTTVSDSGSPNSARCSCSKHLENRVRKKSQKSRYSVFNRIQDVLRGVKYRTETKSSPMTCNQELYQESVESLTADKKIPAGHSTIILDDPQLSEASSEFESIQPPKLVQIPRTLKIFGDPGISKSANSNHALKFDSDNIELPLDLSVRPSSSFTRETIENTFNGRKIIAYSAETCRELFPEVAESLEISKDSKTGGKRRLIRFCNKISRMMDENHNVPADLENVENTNIEDSVNVVRDSEASKLGFLSKTNGFPRKIKKILHIGGQDISNGNEILHSSRKGHVAYLSREPIGFQRYSKGTNSQLNNEMSERNSKDFCASESSINRSSYYDCGFSSTDDEKYFDLPFTAL